MGDPPPAIWLGDAIRVFSALPRAERRILVASLGLQDTSVRLAKTQPPPSMPTPEPLPPPEPPVPPSTPHLDLLRPVEGLVQSQSPAPRPKQYPTTGLVASASHRPLLPPGRDQRVLYAAFARPRPVPMLDIQRAIQRAARLQPLVPVPLMRRLSLVAGSKLLVDIGAGLELFAADQADVVRSAERLIGRQAVHVEKFRQVPTRPAGTGRGPVWTWRPYRPPPPWTPVVIVTDLGLGAPLTDAAPAAPFEWIEFFDALARREIVPVVLIPYPAARVPPLIRRRAVIVHWDHDARPTRIRRTIKTRSRRSP